MSIAAANAVYMSGYNAPTASGQILATEQTGAQARVICGTAEATLDGSLTAFDVNWIDGTATLSFTPTIVITSRIPGSATDALSTIALSGVSAITTTKFTQQITAAGTNGHHVKIAFYAF